MWTLELPAAPGAILSDGVIRFGLTLDERNELLASIGLLLGRLSAFEFEEKMNAFCDNSQHVPLRGDLIRIDEDNPNVFVLRLWGELPGEYQRIQAEGFSRRFVEYRFTRADAEDLYATESTVIEFSRPGD
ncbi:hypothetical protein Enr13x_32710 [Stieleria neptunia]|uniref:Uncharacterized protein n=1 Tax=Stieleria neptunia TaxID=2527979 RepID=A0A518HRE3_9BACT|nr:hypothetical protein Enr13x_32710 [Stieleria neptunia]